MDNGWIKVEGLDTSERYETVYNLEIEDDHTYFVGCAEWGFSVWAHNACAKPIGLPPIRRAHGKQVHNGLMVGEALAIMGKPGVSGTRTNQAIVDSSGQTLSRLQPDVQYIIDDLIHIIEVNVSGGPKYHDAREKVIRSLLGPLFGSYTRR